MSPGTGVQLVRLTWSCTGIRRPWRRSNYSPGRTYRVCAFMAGCYARLADMEHARVERGRMSGSKPGFSTGHFMAKQPFKNPADAASLTESLRMAGLPE